MKQLTKHSFLSPILSLRLACIGLACCTTVKLSLFAQGNLEPDSAPAPTMHSLQEIWDRIESQALIIEEKINTIEIQRQKIQALEYNVGILSRENTMLLNAAGVELPWSIQVVDSKGSFRQYASLAFGSDNLPAIAYFNNSVENLKFAQFNGSYWETTTVHDDGCYGYYCALAFSPDGAPAIASCRQVENHKNLIYSIRSGSTWVRTVVDDNDGVGSYTSIAFSPDGNPAIAYYDGPSGRLKFAYFDGANWQIEVVDDGGNDGTVGKHNSLAFNPAGQPCISYYRKDIDDDDGDLMYASKSGNTWTIEKVEDGADVGQFTSLAFAPDGYPAISYYAVTYTNLKYAKFDGENWNNEIVIGSGNAGRYSSLAFGIDGNPRITHYYESNLELRTWNGSSWVATQIDTAGDVGKFCSLVISPSGQPAAAYFDDTHDDLKFAIRKPFSNP